MYDLTDGVVSSSSSFCLLMSLSAVLALALLILLLLSSVLVVFVGILVAPSFSMMTLPSNPGGSCRLMASTDNDRVGFADVAVEDNSARKLALLETFFFVLNARMDTAGSECMEDRNESPVPCLLLLLLLAEVLLLLFRRCLLACDRCLRPSKDRELCLSPPLVLDSAVEVNGISGKSISSNAATGDVSVCVCCVCACCFCCCCSDCRARRSISLDLEEAVEPGLLVNCCALSSSTEDMPRRCNPTGERKSA
mmetsp:Transcript_17258/g.48562  ORF Transcript_17258/g.48562 Transcript_17258/m.48562 type:complete len:252 (-) Transcript_17258:700-1455(-)